MADNNLEEILKPFHHRASEAEVRLERLEAAVASDRNSRNVELGIKVSELMSELENVKAEQAAEKEKVQKELQQLIVENAKLQYRMTHLLRALKDADSKLLSKCDTELAFRDDIQETSEGFYLSVDLPHKICGNVTRNLWIR